MFASNADSWVMAMGGYSSPARDVRVRSVAFSTRVRAARSARIRSASEMKVEP